MSNTSHSGMPIRLTSDGHTLSNGGGTLPDGRVEILLCTPKTTLVPADHLSTENLASHLRNVGLHPTAEEVVVVSQERDGIVAVMTIGRTLSERLSATGAEIRFCSPLLEDDIKSDGVAIALYGKVLYVRVIIGGLRFAEAMEITTDADITYNLGLVASVYDIYNMYARVSGDCKRLQRVIKPMFKNLVCE